MIQNFGVGGRTDAIATDDERALGNSVDLAVRSGERRDE